MHSKCKNMVNRIVLLTLAMVAFTILAVGQDWEIPEAEKSKTSPVAFNKELNAIGRTIYEANCKSCHGDPGKGNYAQLDPLPIDPASREFQDNTDGDIFYILRTGRGLMPSFSGVLTEMERWAVIAYLRSSNRSYIQPPLAKIIDLELTGTLALILTTKPENHKVFAQLVDTADGLKKPIPNAQIKLMVKRMFGNLNIGEATSNDMGIAEFTFPNNLPGDTIGNITIMAIAGTEGKEVQSTTVEPMGTKVIPYNLLSQRAWWNVNAMAPVWLIATFTLSIIAGLMAIAYVLLLLYKIKMHNSPKTN